MNQKKVFNLKVILNIMMNIDDSIKNIQTLSLSGESVCTGLAEKFPKILGELEDSISGINGLFSVDKQIDSGEDSFELEIILNHLRRSIQKTLFKVRSNNEIVLDAVYSLKHNMEKLFFLEDVLSEFNNFSEEIALLSLNAMIIARKAGKSGNAFSVITRELLSLTEKIKEIVKNINDLSERIQDLYSGYEPLVLKIQRNEEDIVKEFKKTLEALLEELELQGKLIFNFLTGTVEGIDNIKPPLFEIMENIQFYDIIKQSIDQIILLFNELKKDSVTPLDGENLIAAIQIFTLSNKIMDEIIETFSSKNEFFNKKSNTIEKLINKLIDQQEQYKKGKGKLKDFNIKMNFDKATYNLLEGLIKEIQEAEKEKSLFHEKNKGISKSLQMMSQYFEDFANLEIYFKNIIIAAQMEVSKQQSIRQLSQTFQNATKMINDVFSDVEHCRKNLLDFINKGFFLREDFSSILDLNFLLISDFGKEVEEAIKKIYIINRNLDSTADKLLNLSERFHSFFRQTSTDLEILGRQNECFKDLAIEIANAKNALGDQLKNKSSNCMYQNMGLENLVGIFTITKHKEMADRLGVLEYEEERLEAGEVTLF